LSHFGGRAVGAEGPIQSQQYISVKGIKYRLSSSISTYLKFEDGRVKLMVLTVSVPFISICDAKIYAVHGRLPVTDIMMIASSPAGMWLLRRFKPRSKEHERRTVIRAPVATRHTTWIWVCCIISIEAPHADTLTVESLGAPDTKSFDAPDTGSLEAPDSESIEAPDSDTLTVDYLNAPDADTLTAEALHAPDTESLEAPDVDILTVLGPGASSSSSDSACLRRFYEKC
jgi:hypothetical protein